MPTFPTTPLSARPGGGRWRFDVVIGSRYVAGGSTLYCTLPRRALSEGANFIARMVLGLSAGDATAAFGVSTGCARVESLWTKSASEGYSFLIEMLYRRQRQAGTWASADCIRKTPTRRIQDLQDRDSEGHADRAPIGMGADTAVSRGALASLDTRDCWWRVLFVAIFAMVASRGQPADNRHLVASEKRPN